MTDTNQKSKSYALVVDEDTNTILSTLLNIAHEQKTLLFTMCRDFGVENSKVLAFIKEVADKEHELGWCQDPNCKIPNQKGHEVPEKLAIPVHVCTCGYKANASQQVRGDERPDARSISLCAGCAKIWIFNADRTLREPTEVELNEIRTDGSWSTVEATRKHILDYRKEHPYDRNARS